MKVSCFVMLVFALSGGFVSASNPLVTFHVGGAVEGDIVLELYPDEAPVTVENFINYVHAGFYDGLIFHRVIPGFMIQGGGFGPDFNDPATNPPIVNESYNGLSNVRGTIAMARTAHPHSATSQFFINHGNNTADADPALGETNLDQQLVFDYYNTAYHKIGYAVFGEVVSGMDVVDAIAAVETENGVDVPDLGTFDNVPVNDIIIETAELSNPVCLEKLGGDVDGDCDVDIADLARLAGDWLGCNAINGC